jgi:hypothetical protein
LLPFSFYNTQQQPSQQQKQRAVQNSESVMRAYGVPKVLGPSSILDGGGSKVLDGGGSKYSIGAGAGNMNNMGGGGGAGAYGAYPVS